MFLLPTKNKVANVRRFFMASQQLGMTMPGMVIVNDDDLAANRSAYDALKMHMPPNWTIEPVHADCLGAAMRAVWDRVKNLPWIGLVADDHVPASAAWDSELVKSLSGWNVVSTNDDWQAKSGDIHKDRMHGAIAWSGDLARAVGYLFPDNLQHIFQDDIWETLGRETGCWQIRTDIMVKHVHEALSGIHGPTMDRNSDLWKHDEAVFERWKDEDRVTAIGAIREMMKRYGVTVIKPDFTGVKLMIATPAHDGRYESAFMQSLWQTFDFMRSNNVQTEFAEEKYTADIALARSKLFSAFLRSGCTHLLMIDADMGWSLDAVLRLFWAKKDMVAVAGPKKRYPLQFAANFTDDRGDPIIMTYDPPSGTMEVGEIGAAFMLVTRECGLKMAKSYPELAYIGLTHEIEHALFMPMVDKKRWYSEDFAFCKRWRNIGGKVFLVPDVRLKHVGAHTFEGSFSESVMRQEAERRLASDQQKMAAE